MKHRQQQRSAKDDEKKGGRELKNPEMKTTTRSNSRLWQSQPPTAREDRRQKNTEKKTHDTDRTTHRIGGEEIQTTNRTTQGMRRAYK
jgi:hypothetical protein